MMRPSLLPVMDQPNITDEMRDAALKQTAEIVGELDKIRQRLQLPVDMLPLVAETYGSALYAIATKAWDDEQRAKHKAHREKMKAQFERNAGATPPTFAQFAQMRRAGMVQPLGGFVGVAGGGLDPFDPFGDDDE